MLAKQKFFVGLQDVGEGNRISNKALIEALSNAANVHGLMVGQSTGEKDISHLSWVVLNWKLKVTDRPGACEIIEVATWGRSYKGLVAGRDYEITDSKGKVIGKATSEWVAINPDTGRPIKLKPEQIEGYQMEEGRVNFPDFRFSKQVPEMTVLNRIEFKVIKSMIDMNGHVHNASYIDLAEEVLPEGIDKLLFNDIEVCYRKEIKPGETVIIEYSKNLEDYYVIIKDRTDGSVHSVIIMKDPEANR